MLQEIGGLSRNFDSYEVYSLSGDGLNCYAPNVVARNALQFNIPPHVLGIKDVPTAIAVSHYLPQKYSYTCITKWLVLQNGHSHK